MTATLTITRGVPGSGKTTWAKKQPGWRVNRDDLRAMLKPTWDYGIAADEELLTSAAHAAIRALLFAGAHVIVDDTNLHPSHVTRLESLADNCGAKFVLMDFTDVPLATCIRRDAARPNPVGADIITAMWRKNLAPVHEDPDPGMPAEVQP